MRLLIHSNAPWAATGYGVQTRLLAPRLNALPGHEVAVSAFYGLEGAKIIWRDGIPIYPRVFHGYGMDIVSAHGQDFGADVCLTLIDAWVMQPEKITEKGMRWAPLFPVDHDRIPEIVASKIRQAWQPITYSRSAYDLARAAGMGPLYAPHMIETSEYFPEDKAEARRRLGLPPSAFIIGIVAANKGQPSRKALPQQFEAFARFHAKHPDSRLYLHMHLGVEMQGLDIAATARAVGIPDEAILVCDQYRNALGYPDDRMRLLYSAMDVLSSPTMGEGFGVPIIEAQACGTPVIVGDWTAMAELLGAGWAISQDDATPFLTPQNAYQYLPHVEAIEAAYEKALEARDDESLRDAAVTFAARYEADQVVAEYWVPAMEKMQERLDSGGPAGESAVEVL